MACLIPYTTALLTNATVGNMFINGERERVRQNVQLKKITSLNTLYDKHLSDVHL